MDDSKTYIKMCDCPEIQEHNEYLYGGYSTRKGTDKTLPFTIDDSWYIKLNRMTTTWLPRQDQLQEMVRKEIPHPLLYDFFMWVYKPSEHGGIYGEVNQFTSMEQLWLTFVMKEEHDKVWTGTEWKEER